MRLKYLLFSIALILNLTSCASMGELLNLPGPPVQRMPFPSAEYEKLPKTGNSTVSGRMELTSKNNITLRADRVELVPVTSYSREWYEKGYTNGLNLTERDPLELKYIKFQNGLEDDDFLFENVPAGDYYLVGLVSWWEPSYLKGGTSVFQKIKLVKQIVVKNGSDLDASCSFTVPWIIREF